MTNQHTQTFQFTLGPVQGFVAQARRTRDFWAGSFILSWLSSVAIAAIQKQGGVIQFPVPDKSYMAYLMGDTAQQGSKPPQQGSIPNRFMATTATVPGDFKPEWVTEAVQAAWRALAQAVWNGDLKDYQNSPTQDIWQRQIKDFWEVSWVLSDGKQPSLLDRRKNWRNPVLPAEPGHKCMMMDGWQELSGITAVNMKQINTFWSILASNGQKGIASDIDQGGQEHLCAMAFIKRRFSRYFAGVKLELPGCGGTIQGWPVPSAVPSVAFLAAAPWLAEAIKRTPQAFEAFNESASQLVDYSEAEHVKDGGFEIDIASVKEAAKQAPGFKRIWAGLDGQVYFESALENYSRIFGPHLHKAARATSRALSDLVRTADVGKPSPYYAILRMDGDQLGKHMGDKNKQQPISQALNQFTNGAGDLVRQHNGFLIYAGGDDVLALFSLEDALPAAAALQAAYKAAFKQQDWTCEEVKSTLSGAIEFVHFRTPLARVLADSNQLLDEVAKDQTGRDAIAVRVQKPSGVAAQWTMPWEKALDSNGNILIMQVAEAFAAQSSDDDGQGEAGLFSNKFFFRMKDLLERFNGMSQGVMEQLLLTEYLHSYGSLEKKAKLDMGQLQTHLSSLLEQCWQYQRPEAGAKPEPHKDKPINADAALLVRFLAQKGLERE